MANLPVLNLDLVGPANRPLATRALPALALLVCLSGCFRALTEPAYRREAGKRYGRGEIEQLISPTNLSAGGLLVEQLGRMIREDALFREDGNMKEELIWAIRRFFLAYVLDYDSLAIPVGGDMNWWWEREEIETRLEYYQAEMESLQNGRLSNLYGPGASSERNETIEKAMAKIREVLAKEVFEREDLEMTEDLRPPYLGCVPIVYQMYDMPKHDAIVAFADNDIGFTILNIGEKEGVRIGYEFTLYRETRYLAQGVVLHVFEDATVLFMGLIRGNVRAGDRASTQIY